MEMNEKEILMVRASFLHEIISKKIEQINGLLESIKRFEGHSSGSKDILEKVSGHIKKQQLEIASLSSQQKMPAEMAKFVGNVLEGVKNFVVLTCGDAERLYCSKQGELLSLQQEAEKLNSMKIEYEKKIKELELEEKELEQNKSNESNKTVADIAEKPEKNKRVRPDKDPNTRAGRAAMDIAERRKKYQKKSS